MIQRKADHECVSIILKKVCERHRETISTMQDEIRRNSKGTKLPGKEKAIKAIIDGYEQRGVIINELRAQLKECIQSK